MRIRLPKFARRLLHAVAVIVSAVPVLAIGLLMAQEQAAAQASPGQMIASLDGVDTAYARRYEFEDHLHGHSDDPVSDPETWDRGMTSASITILSFDSDASAEQAWKLTNGSLVAGTIIHEEPTDLVLTEIPGMGDSAAMYLLPDEATADDDTDATGILFVREGTTGFIIEGEGDSTNAALGERLQEFATFILDHPSSDDPVTVLHEGNAEGGDFERMPNVDSPETLRGLVPLYDYDLLVSEEPIAPNVEPACGCTPPASA